VSRTSRGAHLASRTSFTPPTTSLTVNKIPLRKLIYTAYLLEPNPAQPNPPAAIKAAEVAKAAAAAARADMLLKMPLWQHAMKCVAVVALAIWLTGLSSRLLHKEADRVETGEVQSPGPHTHTSALHGKYFEKDSENMEVDSGILVFEERGRSQVFDSGNQMGLALERLTASSCSKSPFSKNDKNRVTNGSYLVKL
jgi:hypothetical protein